MTFTEILSLRKMNFSHYKMTLNWGISRNDWNDKLIDDDRGRIESHLLFYGCVATSLEICAKSCCVRKISKEDLKQKQWEARGIKNVPCFLWHLWETNYLGKFIHIQPLWHRARSGFSVPGAIQIQVLEDRTPRIRTAYEIYCSGSDIHIVMYNT